MAGLLRTRCRVTASRSEPGGGYGISHPVTGSGPEQIRRCGIRPTAWSEESGHLTPTLKLKRAKVLADYAADVEALYAPRT